MLIIVNLRVIVIFMLCRRGKLNIFNSIQPIKRMLGVISQVISQTPSESVNKFSPELPSLYTFFGWVLIVPLLLFLISGCGKYTEELDNAKQQIDKLNTEVKKLTEENLSLNKEKSRLSDDFKILSNNNTLLQREFDQLNKTKAALFAENKEIKKKYSAALEEIASMKREKADLTAKIQDMKKKLSLEVTSSPKPVDSTPMEVDSKSTEQMKDQSPCDAVLAFMKASEGIVRHQKGIERTNLLERVKQQYTSKMKEAPEKAIKAAENWVKEGTKFWDNPSDDSTFRLLQLRNTVLETCGKSAQEAGF